MELGVNKCKFLSQVTLVGKVAIWLRFLAQSIAILPVVRGVNTNEVIASMGNEELCRWGNVQSVIQHFRRSVQNSLSVLVRFTLNIHLPDHTLHFQPRFLRVVISSLQKGWDSVKPALSMPLPGSPFISSLLG